jgi:hypothetical protein
MTSRNTILHRSRTARRAAGLSAVALLASAGVAAAAPSSAPISGSALTKGATMSVSNARPLAGNKITISGDAPLDARSGSWLTLESSAFSSRLRADRMPAVRTQVSAQGTYDVTATVARTAEPNTMYTVSGSYDGAMFPTASPLYVRSSQKGASIQLPQGKAVPGSTITITGDAPLDARTGKWITLVSPAFDSSTRVGGVPAVRTQVNAQGTYSVKATIKPGIVSYNAAPVTGSFEGQGFPKQATIKIDAGLNGTVHVIYHNARGTAAPGTKVILVGDGPSSAPGGIRTGDQLTFTSTAFAHGMVSVELNAQGTYQVNAKIAPGTKPGTYAVTGSYRGMPFRTGDTVKVVG